MENKLKLIIDSLGSERVRSNEDLSTHLYSKEKVVAEAFYIATSTQELIKILDMVEDLKVPLTILGGGTKFIISKPFIEGIVIKNRSSNIKIAGFKGKVGKGMVGVDEALVLVDSGVSLTKLNGFLSEQKLQDVSGFSSLNSTVGGAIFVDQGLQQKLEKITVWSQGDVSDTKLEDLNIDSDVVLSVVFRLKAL